MRITVKDGSRSIHIRIPTCLVFSKAVAKIGSFTIRKYASEAAVNIPPEALELLFSDLRRIKKKHKNWEFVNVESASGETVKIIL